MIIYLTESQIIEYNRLVIERYSPTEPVELVSPSALNMIVNLPRQYVFGQALYPTVLDKATILFVQLVKKHCFANGNKRTAFLALTSFLRLNGLKLEVSKEEAVTFTVQVAEQALDDKQLDKYKHWIEERVVTL